VLPALKLLALALVLVACESAPASVPTSTPTTAEQAALRSEIVQPPLGIKTPAEFKTDCAAIKKAVDAAAVSCNREILQGCFDFDYCPSCTELEKKRTEYKDGQCK
jgi:hypothetical protein